MDAPAPLFDLAARAMHRNRAARAPALFLHETVAFGVTERLQEVNRSFTAPAVVAPFAKPWRKTFPDARIVADDEVLGLARGAHDLVLHALCLHGANDPVGQLVQCRLALKPDGLLIAALFGGQTLHELRACLAKAEVTVTGGLSPRVAPMGDIRDLGALLSRAGLALPVADGETMTVSYADAFHLMRDLRAMGEANALTARLRHPTRAAVLTEAARLYAERHADGDGRITATFEIVTLTGWAPAATQPQPLRPGSATARLAEALGAVETPLTSTQD